MSEELAEEIEERQEEGETRSECIRRYLRTGLDAEDQGPQITIGMYFIWMGSIFAAAAYVTAIPAAGHMGIVMMIGGYLANEDRLDRLRDAARERYNDLQAPSDENAARGQ